MKEKRLSSKVLQPVEPIATDDEKIKKEKTPVEPKISSSATPNRPPVTNENQLDFVKKMNIKKGQVFFMAQQGDEGYEKVGINPIRGSDSREQLQYRMLGDAHGAKPRTMSYKDIMAGRTKLSELYESNYFDQPMMAGN